MRGQSNPGAGNAFVATFTLNTNGWTIGALRLNAGDMISIAGVNDVDPETKASLGRLKQFVVTATISDTAGSIVDSDRSRHHHWRRVPERGLRPRLR